MHDRGALRGRILQLAAFIGDHDREGQLAFPATIRSLGLYIILPALVGQIEFIIME
jgi:hypothetical protein